MKKSSVLILLIVLLLSACQKEKNTNYSDSYKTEGTAIVVNEGAFLQGNASISFIDREGNVIDNIFSRANNGLALGDVAQSYTVCGNYGLIIVNNSQKVVLVNAATFKLETIFDVGFDYPRYAWYDGNRYVYIANGNAVGNVQILDLTTKTITKSIAVGKGPEQFLKVNNQLWVINTGGYAADSTISVIDLNTQTEVDRFSVGSNPTAIAEDGNGNIWVLCKGYIQYDPITYEPNRQTKATLVKINPTTKSVVNSFTLIEEDNDISAVAYLAVSKNKSQLYYKLDNDLYQLSTNATLLNASVLVNELGIYGMSVHPNTGDVWLAVATSFAGNGKIKVYTESGELKTSYTVGIGPNTIVFN
ncbi:MAG: hypothetical protein H6553_04525 [Chitinophagales bacterium]|nr:hypothetical protein [Chitinophagales bacterium]